MDKVFEIWFYNGIIVIALVIIWYGIRLGVRKVSTSYDKLTEAIQELNLTIATQKQQILSIEMRIKQNENRLNNHSNRIRKIEIKR